MVTHYIQLSASMYYINARIQVPVSRRTQHGQRAYGVSVHVHTITTVHRGAFCFRDSSLLKEHFFVSCRSRDGDYGGGLCVYVCENSSDVPKYKQRIAGKSLPMEKFAVKKSQRFFNQNNRLFMPAVELLYLWNLFNVFGKRKSLCDNLYRLIDKNIKDLEKNPGTILSIITMSLFFIAPTYL